MCTYKLITWVSAGFIVYCCSGCWQLSLYCGCWQVSRALTAVRTSTSAWKGRHVALAPVTTSLAVTAVIVHLALMGLSVRSVPRTHGHTHKHTYTHIKNEAQTHADANMHTHTGVPICLPSFTQYALHLQLKHRVL